MRESTGLLVPVVGLAGALGICCGLPLLLSLGVLGAIAGWSLQSWVLVGLGLALAVVGGTRLVRARRRGAACDRPGGKHRTDAMTDEAEMEHR